MKLIIIFILPAIVALLLLVSTVYAGDVKRESSPPSFTVRQDKIVYDLRAAIRARMQWLKNRSSVKTVTTPAVITPKKDTAVPTVSNTVSLAPQPTIKTEKILGTKVGYGSAVWPVVSQILSSGFGPRQKASENFRYDFHRGIDIPGQKGVDQVMTLADGEIFRTYLENDASNPYEEGGTTIVVRHTSTRPITLNGQEFTKYYSIYTHLDKILVRAVKEGGPYQKVKKGDVIGIVGNSGTTEFAHLHLEVRVGTTCSREYQIQNPTASCAHVFSTPTDPHVNPFMFLNYPDNDTLKVEVTQTGPLQVKVSSARAELDFNEIKVSYLGKEKLVNFNERLGVDPSNIDNNNFGGVKILPAKFNAKTASYEIIFEFGDFANFDKIEAKDIWGKGVRLLRG